MFRVISQHEPKNHDVPAVDVTQWDSWAIHSRWDGTSWIDPELTSDRTKELADAREAVALDSAVPNWTTIMYS